MTTELTYIEDEKQREMFKAFLHVDKNIPKSELLQRLGGTFASYHIEEMYAGWRIYAEYLKFLMNEGVAIGYAKIAKDVDGKKFVVSFSATPEQGYIPVGPVNG